MHYQAKKKQKRGQGRERGGEVCLMFDYLSLIQIENKIILLSYLLVYYSGFIYYFIIVFLFICSCVVVKDGYLFGWIERSSTKILLRM